jgi:hypothetical protein
MTFIPQQADATTQIGFRINCDANVDIYIDEVALRFGDEGIGNETNIGSITIAEKPIYMASLAPTTGTHPGGAIAFNAATTAINGRGWACTTAGTPGTWDPLLMDPVVTTTALNAVGNAINTGPDKRQGYRVFDSTANIPMYATGNANGDTWVGEKAGSTITLSPT